MSLVKALSSRMVYFVMRNMVAATTPAAMGDTSQEMAMGAKPLPGMAEMGSFTIRPCREAMQYAVVDMPFSPKVLSLKYRPSWAALSLGV